MSIPRPRVDVPSAKQLAPALATVGLPEPAKVSVLAPAWIHQNYRLAFPYRSEIPELMLRRVVSFPGYETLKREAAGLRVARQIPDLPVVNRFQLFPTGALPWAAAISDLLPGVQGGSVIRKAKDLRPHVAQTVGRIMAQLEDHPVPRFGTRVDGESFRGRRSTWREEWSAVLHGFIERARSAGAWLGPLSDLLLRQIQEQMGALDTATTWALVHDDLHASNLLFAHGTPGADPPRLTGLVDWEGAFVGDSLAEWASLMERPPALIGHILQGYGTDRARALLEDADAMARMEVYTRTRGLKRLSFCAASLFRGEYGARRCYVLEYARMICADLVQDQPVRTRLEAALELGASTAIGKGVQISPENRLIWRVLDATRFHPLPTGAHAEVFACALASIYLAADAPSDAKWFTQSEEAIKLLGRQRTPLLAEPIVDRVAWCDALQNRIADATSERMTAWTCWWLARCALNQLSDSSDVNQWPVSDDLLRGLETWLNTVLESDAMDTELPPTGLLLHGTLGLASCVALEAMQVGSVPETMTQRAREQVQMACEDIAIFQERTTAPVEFQSFMPLVAGRETLNDSIGFLGGPLCYALQRLPSELPVSADHILSCLGLGDLP